MLFSEVLINIPEGL